VSSKRLLEGAKSLSRDIGFSQRKQPTSICSVFFFFFFFFFYFLNDGDKMPSPASLFYNFFLMTILAADYVDAFYFVGRYSANFV
jgi:hypothetical protein